MPLPFRTLVSDASWNALVSIARPIDVGEDTLLFDEGEAASEMLVIESGQVAIRRWVGGVHRQMTTCGEGDVVGEMGLIDGSPRSAQAVATTRVVGRVVTRDDLDALMTREPQVAAEVWSALARTLAERLRESNNRWREVYESWLAASGVTTLGLHGDVDEIRMVTVHFATGNTFTGRLLRVERGDLGVNVRFRDHMGRVSLVPWTAVARFEVD